VCVFEKMSNLRTMFYEKFTDLANMVSNPLQGSKFLDEGVLTPEEFVATGDMLSQKCPSWKWCSSKTNQKGLPPEKQYLITKNVVCVQRVADFETSAKTTNEENLNFENDEWTVTHTNVKMQKEDEIPEIPTEKEEKYQSR